MGTKGQEMWERRVLVMKRFLAVLGACALALSLGVVSGCKGKPKPKPAPPAETKPEETKPEETKPEEKKTTEKAGGEAEETPPAP